MDRSTADAQSALSPHHSRHAAMPVLVEAEADGTRVIEESAVLSHQA